MKEPKRKLFEAIVKALKKARESEDNFLMAQEVVWAIRKGLNPVDLDFLNEELTRILAN